MEIYSVTPQMERHMNNTELFGVGKPLTHSIEEEDAANQYLDGEDTEFDDTFVYEELDKAPEPEIDDTEELLQAALDDICKKLDSEKPKAAKKSQGRKVAVQASKEVPVGKPAIPAVKVKPKYIMKGERYGGVLHGLL